MTAVTGAPPALTREQYEAVRAAKPRYGYVKRLAREFCVCVTTIRRARRYGYRRYSEAPHA